MILNLGSGRFPLAWAVNLDLENGWDARGGIPFLEDSVDGVTISHMLMYLRQREQLDLMREIVRVCRSGAAVRITEDDCRRTENRWHDAVDHLMPGRLIRLLEEAGMWDAREVGPTESAMGDLAQSWHGDPPKVFHVEARCP